VLLQTLSRYKRTRQLHFADAYVAAVALSRQHGVVVSFDREFRRIPGLTLIQDTDDIE
jgi:predicted nucleic acid-binding protein